MTSMNRLQFANLSVVHRRRDKTGGGMPATVRETLVQKAFFTSTCMREFAVFSKNPELSSLPFDRHTWLSTGQDAYLFLLLTITGLNSSVPGETNVQGQVRNAWNEWRHRADADSLATLNPVMHRLFSDSRRIRQQHLQGIGGHSYGSLARKLINPDPSARILFVGAGELARSVLPFFSSWQTALWNRHAIDTTELQAERCFAPDESNQAAGWASHVILSTPPNRHNDTCWFTQLTEQSQPPQVLHLGLRRARPGAWRPYPACQTLDDLFDLRKSLSSLRSLNISRARKNCEQLAAEIYGAISAPDIKVA